MGALSSRWSSAPSWSLPAGLSSGASGCQVAYRIVNQWQTGSGPRSSSGYGGSSAIRSWTVRLGFAGGQQVTQLWGGVYTQAGTAVTVGNESWNGSLGAGASTSFGFLATWSGTNTTPTATCTAT